MDTKGLDGPTRWRKRVPGKRSVHALLLRTGACISCCKSQQNILPFTSRPRANIPRHPRQTTGKEAIGEQDILNPEGTDGRRQWRGRAARLVRHKQPFRRFVSSP